MDETQWVERYAWFGTMENLQGVNEVRHQSDEPIFGMFADISGAGRRDDG
jgi:hypothetical protein